MNTHTTTREAVASATRDQVQVAVMAIDLTRIAWKLRHPDHGMEPTDQEVGTAIERYRKFLYLKATRPGEHIIPTVEVDDVWHTHIIFTKQYAADCDAIFGYFLHHTPVIPPLDGCDEGERQTLLTTTQIIWREAFGAAEELGSLAPRQNGSSATNCSGWC